MIDRNERNTSSRSCGASEVEPNDQSAGQPGSARNRNGVDGVPLRLRFRKCASNRRRKMDRVFTRRQFRHNAAPTSMYCLLAHND
jgi:hypothetical protein